MKSESGFSFEMASQPFIKMWHNVWRFSFWKYGILSGDAVVVYRNMKSIQQQA